MPSRLVACFCFFLGTAVAAPIPHHADTPALDPNATVRSASVRTGPTARDWTPAPLTAEQLARGTAVKLAVLPLLISELSLARKEVQRGFWPEVNDGANYGTYTHNDTLLSYSTVMLAYTMAVYHFPNGAAAHPSIHSVPVTSDLHDVRPAIAVPFQSEEINGAPNLYCTLADAEADGEIDFNSATNHSFNYHYTSFDGSIYNSQAAIYRWERRDEVVFTVAFRGSETLHLSGDFSSTVARSAEQIIGDWLGTDFDLTPEEDLICGDPDMRMHRGFQNAYLLMGRDINEALASLLTQERSKPLAERKPIKVIATGHSLGAALADMFTYDASCGGTTGGDVLGQPLAGTITFGHASHWYGQRSMEVFKEAVPPAKRVRWNSCAREQEGWSYYTGQGLCEHVLDASSCGTCSYSCGGPDCDRNCEWWNGSCRRRKAWCLVKRARCQLRERSCNLARNGCLTTVEAQQRMCAGRAQPENMFASCDIIGTTLPANRFGFDGFYHPDDGDFQAAWIVKRTNDQLRSAESLIANVMTRSRAFANSFGTPNAVIPHLLDSYSEGVRRSDRFNAGICAKIDRADYLLTPDDDTFADDPLSVAAGVSVGVNQVGYPEGRDQCWCTGSGTQIRCSQSGLTSCGARSGAAAVACTSMPPLPFGDWRMCIYP